VVPPRHRHKARLRDSCSNFATEFDWVGTVITNVEDESGCFYPREKMSDVEIADYLEIAHSTLRRRTQTLTNDLRAMLPTVLSETGIDKESSLNAIIGGKSAHFIDLHHEVILSLDQYATLSMRGFREQISPPDARFPNSHRRNFEMMRGSKAAQKYFMLFLKRSYLKHFEELSKVRPHLTEAEVWIGQNKAD
jgi:hypothetical protein